MRTSIMQTYNELMNAKKQPARSAELFYEYVSPYRRVVMVLDGSTWELRVTYHGFAKELKGCVKTYGDKSICAAWTLAQVNNRDIRMGCLTIKEAPGKVIINRITN
jgi:hypothetical protein